MIEAARGFRRECRDFVECRVREGFAGRAEIVQGVADYLAGDYDIDDNTVQSVVDEALEVHLRDQRSWPERTDCDRLDMAFEILDRGGIVARQNYWCCQTCAGAAITDEMDARKQGGETVRGYIFYHLQDTEGAAKYGHLYLAFGSDPDDPSSTPQIGHEIVVHLEELGFRVAWNGDLAQRIVVEIDWKRRRADDGEPILPSTAEGES